MTAADDICAECLRPRHLHHRFVKLKRPPTCVCDPGEWEGRRKIPLVCRVGFKGEPGKVCDICEHDEGCHG